MPAPTTVPIQSARSNFLKNVKLLVFSPPKHGKTLLAATLSEHFKGWPAPEPTFLSDLLYVGFDPNPLEGLIEQGYDAHLFDRSTHVGNDLLPMLGKLATEIPMYVEAHGIKTVVIDTISFLDKNIQEFMARTYEKWDLHRAVLNTHTRFVSILKSLNVTVIVNAHSKADMAATDTQGQINEKATALPGSGGISAQLGGQTKGTYESMVSMILPLQARDIVKDGKPARVRVLLPFGGSSFEGASRYQRYLSKEEPADLKTLFAKIKAGVEAEWSKTKPTQTGAN